MKTEKLDDGITSLINLTKENYLDITITPKYIKALIESKTHIRDIGLKTRKRPYPYYRNIYYQLCRNFTEESLFFIGKNMNNRDHASVIHGLKRFDEHKDQNWFKDYYSFYLMLCKLISSEISKSKNLDIKQLITTEDVKQHYKIMFIKLVDKYRSIINKQSKQIYNLKNEPLINKIADLDYETFQKLKPRLESFLLMNGK